MAAITIDLARGDSAQEFPKGERLQEAGYELVLQCLADCLEQANRDRDGQGRRCGRSHVHNAIFIDGPRGTGKTAFLLSLRRAWREHREGKGDGCDLCFLPPVDPTLLNNSDNFLNVIVARIYATVADLINEERRNAFWDAFDRVGDALEAETNSTDDNIRGSERLMAFRDHNKLEEHLESLFREACHALGAKALVILIDDVDMSLDKGFHILDVVRRYLASPLVIPVVSGDIELYDTLLTLHFAKELGAEDRLSGLAVEHWRQWSPDQDQDSFLVGRARDLSREYLNKVLPIHQRAKLRLIPELIDLIEVRTGPDSLLKLNDIFRLTAASMSFKANGEEGTRCSFQPAAQTARELLQLLLALKRANLPWQEDAPEWEKSDVRGKVAAVAFANAQARYDGADEFRAKADLEILRQRGALMRMTEIKYFDPKQHPRDRASYRLELARRTRASDEVPERTLPKALMPMPNVEMFIPDLVITKPQWRLSVGGEARFLMRLFTHSGYYSTIGTSNLLLFGRAFELVVSNLIGIVEVGLIETLLVKPPFYSFFHFFPTKHVSVLTEGDEASPDGDGEEVPDVELWSGRIREWRVKQEWLSAHPPSAHLIYKVLNKSFTQFNLYKDVARPGGGGSLADQMLRFSLILLNAFASFEGDPKVVTMQNIALRNPTNFKGDRSWVRNIKPLLDRDEPSFTKALATHPLIEPLLKAVESGEGMPCEHIPMGSNSPAPPTKLTEPLTRAEGERLRAQNAKISGGDKRAATRALLNILGEVGDMMRRIDRGDAPRMAATIIDLVRDNLASLSHAHRSSLCAQLYASGGYPGRIRQILRWAGRLDELIRLLQG